MPNYPLTGMSHYEFTDSEPEMNDEDNSYDHEDHHSDHETGYKRRPQLKSKNEQKKPMRICLPTSGMLLPPFILSKGEVNFASWKNILRNELSAWDLEFMLDGTMLEDLPETELKKAIGWTNAFILSRLDNWLKQVVADLATPAEMLGTLGNIVQPVIPTARFAVKRSFQTILTKDDETVDNFIKRFDECKKRMELYDNSTATDKKQIEADKKQREIDAIDNFLAAIKHRYKDVVTSFNAKEENTQTLQSLKAELKSEEGIRLVRLSYTFYTSVESIH